MAQDEIPPFEKPDELTSEDALSRLRKYALGEIQKRTREAMRPSQIEVSEGAIPQPNPLPEGDIEVEDPFESPYEYFEDEA
tara:strand:- start:4631 stop:4873 length:243 start_codon:yes stop_codon:yes gene_type:complete